MRIGIIAEGKGDLAVVENIIKGITGYDDTNFHHLRPSDEFDETDLGRDDPTRSTWSMVKKECLERKSMAYFLSLEDSKYVVIHLDTDKAQDYKVDIPKRDKEFCTNLRLNVVTKIKEWLNQEFLGKILFAVAVDEIDAWLLTIYGKQKDTSILPNAKGTLSYLLNKKNINTTSNYNNFKKISKPFSKKKEVQAGDFLTKNCSLRFFYEEIEQMWKKENN